MALERTRWKHLLVFSIFCEVVRGDWMRDKVWQASRCRWLPVEPASLEVVKGEEKWKSNEDRTESAQGSGELLENFLQTKKKHSQYMDVYNTS